MRKYLNYNKQELLDKVNNISITMNDASQVITKYRDHVTSISNVSKRYEIFDIKKYLLNQIELIEQNFNINKSFVKEFSKDFYVKYKFNF